jgi:hypothetical protein
MAFDREAAIAAGYTNDEINAYLQAERKKSKQPGPVTADVGEPPAPTTQITPVETSAGSIATQGGLAVAPYAGAAALGAGALYGGGVAKKAFDTMQAVNATKQAEIAGLQNRFDARMAQQAGQAVRPVAPVGAPAAAPVAPVAPAAPVAAPQAAAAAEQGIMSRASDIVKRLALDKVMPGLARAGVGAGAALYSSDLGPKTPQTGRMRGMEINPLTGAPWTPEQIAQYEANAAQFDAQMAPPQMRR